MPICLQGGGEFAPACREMDAGLLALGPPGPVVVTALAGRPGSERDTADANGVRHFRALGAEAFAAPDAREDEAGAVAAIDSASVLFLPGGSPARLLRALAPAAVRAALRALVDRGGVLAGASAGAMVLAEWTLLPESGATPTVAAGLGFVPGVVVLPHFSGDTGWLRALDDRAGVTALGLPECSGVVIHDGTWTPVGASAPTLITPRGTMPLETDVSAPLSRDTATDGR